MEPSEASTGLTMQGTEVPMSSLNSIEPTQSEGDETLWTTGMSDCCAVATFDRDTAKRTLCHLPGSNPSAGFFAALADIIQENTVVIVAAGSSSTFDFFSGNLVPLFKDGIINAMQSAGKDTRKLLVTGFHTEDDASQNMQEGSFVIEGDGTYGRGALQ
jgi:hypothetical protein